MNLREKGVLLLSGFMSLTFTAFAGHWEERIVVPAEYQNIEYVAQGELFWLQKPKEKGVKEYFHIKEGYKVLPSGVERGGTKESGGVSMSAYAHDGYIDQKPFGMIEVVAQADKNSSGLIRFDGEEVSALRKTKGIRIYTDGYQLMDGVVFKDGEETGAKGIARRYTPLKDAWWTADKKSNRIVNSKGERLGEFPFAEYVMYSAPELIIGKSNGMDKKKKAYRIWNLNLEEITPASEGFLDLLVLRKSVVKNEVSTQALEGVLGYTKEKGWAFYPYIGNASFGDPIAIEAKEKEYFSAVEVAPGYYRLGRPQGDGDFLLDLQAKKVRRDANGLAFEGKYLTQEKWTSGTFFVPFVGGIGNTWFASIGSIQTDSSHLVRLRTLDGEEVTTLWEAVYQGKEAIVNRYNGETKVITADGLYAKHFRSAKEGYFPLVGKKDIPEQEEGRPQQFGITEWKDWPGGGRYQPYVERGVWSIFDLEALKDHITPQSHYGQIIKVSDDGTQFWSYFQEGKLKGIKQFKWVE